MIDRPCRVRLSGIGTMSLEYSHEVYVTPGQLDFSMARNRGMSSIAASPMLEDLRPILFRIGTHNGTAQG